MKAVITTYAVKTDLTLTTKALPAAGIQYCWFSTGVDWNREAIERLVK